MSGSSLSDSSYSVSSDAALGGVAQLGRAPKMWDRVLLSADNSDILWSEVAVQQQPAMQSKQRDSEPTQGRPVSGELAPTVDPWHANLCTHQEISI